MVGRFAFLPNVRTQIAADASAPAAGEQRLLVSYDVEVTANGSAQAPRVPVQASLRGPGDIIGIQRSAIARVEPPPGLRGFEKNYFPFMEFRDSDYAWRYSFDRGNKARIKPWICLIALQLEEFEFIEHSDAPLPCVVVKDASASLPNLNQSWAFAHVQVNLPDDGSLTVEEALAADPARHFSRLLCPRRLEEGKTYALMLVPAYEAGRLAGTGKRDTAQPFDAPAWVVGQTGFVKLPVYHQTRFTTNSLEDIEVLLRRLRKLSPEETAAASAPKIVSSAKPGYYKSYENPGETFEAQSALRQMGTTPQDVGTDPQLADLMKETLETVIAGETEDDGEDPLVAFPPYGFRFQGDVDVELARALNSRWFDRVNLDLKFRVAASFGAETVQRNQELFSKICWDQYEEIVEANLRLARLGAAQEIAERLAKKHYVNLPADVTLHLTEPIHAFVRTEGGQTLADSVRSKGVPATFTSRDLRRTAAKRQVRPDGGAAGSDRFIPSTAIPGETTFQPSTLLAQLAEAREKSVLSQTGVSQQLSRSLSEIFGSQPFANQKRPRSAGIRVREFKSSQLTTSIPATLVDLPRMKADFTVHGRTDNEQDVLEPIFRSPVVPLPLADYLTSFSQQAILADTSKMPKETVGLFEENRHFVEAFMVGANHELNKELRWQEFPTDMRGTPLRRFWNRGRPPFDPSGDSIAQIHTWAEILGSNLPPGDADQEPNFVVVIRGDIVRKLGDMIVVLNEAPTTEWKSGAGIDHEPVFFGPIGDDTAYYGFDVSRSHILGPNLRQRTFLVFYEPMGRMRFGIDVATAKIRNERQVYDQIRMAFPIATFDRSYSQIRGKRGEFIPPGAGPKTWDDLSWSHMLLTAAGYVRFNRTLAVSGEPDYWGSNRHSASLARSFWQKPVAAVMPLRRVI